MQITQHQGTLLNHKQRKGGYLAADTLALHLLLVERVQLLLLLVRERLVFLLLLLLELVETTGLFLEKSTV